jgi:hypothetical protein
MNNIRITKKLKEAIAILADERMADCSDEAFINALRKGKLKQEQIYKALATMRYTWDAKRNHWIWKPRHMKSIKRIFAIVRKIDDGILAEVTP